MKAICSVLLQWHTEGGELTAAIVTRPVPAYEALEGFHGIEPSTSSPAYTQLARAELPGDFEEMASRFGLKKSPGIRWPDFVNYVTASEPNVSPHQLSRLCTLYRLRVYLADGLNYSEFGSPTPTAPTARAETVSMSDVAMSDCQEVKTKLQRVRTLRLCGGTMY